MRRSIPFRETPPSSEVAHLASPRGRTGLEALALRIFRTAAHSTTDSGHVHIAFVRFAPPRRFRRAAPAHRLAGNTTRGAGARRRTADGTRGPRLGADHQRTVPRDVQ